MQLAGHVHLLGANVRGWWRIRRGEIFRGRGFSSEIADFAKCEETFEVPGDLLCAFLARGGEEGSVGAKYAIDERFASENYAVGKRSHSVMVGSLHLSGILVFLFFCQSNAFKMMHAVNVHRFCRFPIIATIDGHVVLTCDA